MYDHKKALDRFVVEAGRRVVGLAVRVPGGFKFFSTDRRYTSIEGKIFPRVRAIYRRVAQIHRARRTKPTFRPSAPRFG